MVLKLSTNDIFHRNEGGKPTAQAVGFSFVERE